MHRPLQVSIVSALLVAVLTVVKLTLPALDRMTFSLYFVAVLLAAWRGGRGPATVVILLSGFAGHYFFSEPRFTIELHRAALTQTMAFLIEAVAIAEMAGVLRRTRRYEQDVSANLETTLRSIGDAVISTDQRGVVTFMNPVAEELTGWTETEAHGKPLDDVFVAVDEATGERLGNPVGKILLAGKILRLAEHATLVAKGRAKETPIDHSGAPIRDRGGAVRGVVLVFRSLSEQKKGATRRELIANAVSALGSSLDYRTTLARVADLLVPRFADWCAIEMIDERTGRSEQLAVSHSDPRKVALAWELRTKYPPAPDAVTGVQMVLRTGRSEHYPEITDALLERTAVDEEQLRIYRALDLRSAILVPLVARGRSLGVITLVYAESGRRYGKDDLAFLEQLAERAAIAVDNARLYTREREAREAADAAMRLKDEFLATLSHELRTPLTAMLGWSRMLAAGSLDGAKREKALATIDRNAVAMTQLVDDLLDVSRIIGGDVRLDAQTIPLRPAVEEAIEAVKPAAHAKEITIHTALEDGTPVYGDPRRLKQVVWNLVSNAVKFTGRGGKVDVVLRRDGSSVAIAVSDTGSGIDREFLPYVFDRFRQGDASYTRIAGGLGLGLAITRHIVELHGGTVEAESPGKGRGAKFTVRLPLAALHPAAVTEPIRRAETLESRPPPPAECPSELRGARVLVVDDDEDARALVATVLDECGCEVTAAPGVDDAMREFEDHVPDVVLSDIGMPEHDGYELIKRIRDRPPDQGGKVPAAALTAYARADDRRRVLAAGFEMHVVKPVDPSELVAVVTNLVRLAKAS